MHTCAVIACNSNSLCKSITFFRVPMNDEEQAKGWISFITEANSGVIPCISPGRLYVCSRHFRKCCIYPCHPRRTTRINGHLPSVVDGKVILNPKSKCALISSSENLEIYSKPLHRNSLEMQRAYLVKQLTSFGGKRKIVIGNGSGNEKRILKQINEKLCLDEDTENERALNKCDSVVPEEFSDSSSSTGCPPHPQSQSCSLPSEGDNSSPVSTSSDFEENGSSIKEGENYEKLVKSDHAPISKSHRSFFARGKRTTPSSETKMKLLKRDNANLKKSVFVLEKKVEELEKEVQSFRDASQDLEARSKKLLRKFQRRLKQKERKVAKKLDACTSTEVTTNCKCASIVLVDIAED